jgi:hypothetical protein
MVDDRDNNDDDAQCSKMKLPKKPAKPPFLSYFSLVESDA